MSLKIENNLTKVNFNLSSASRIKYIVVHYTANNGDTAWGNTKYFQEYRGASAHYFVDENSVWRSVEDNNIAWHCGTSGAYRHPYCRNSNSIGVELCSRKDSKGVYYIKDETVATTIELVKELMQKYNISIENVIRHYDVTGKICPEPFVMLSNLWLEFKNCLISKTLTPVLPSPIYKVTEANLTTMTNLGIMNSPEYWRNITSIQWLDTLLTNATKIGICDKNINNGITTLDNAFEILISASVITSCEYWKKQVENKIAYMEGLLLNIANKCRIVLEKIVHAEAQGEGLEGQEFVANVILNRVNSDKFPNGIYDVVFESKENADGYITYQFSPISDGAYAKSIPSTSVKEAVTNVLNGKDNSKGAMFFCTKKSACNPNSYHENSLEFLFEHNNHRFYKVK